FLGLLAFAALQEPDWTKTGQLALYLVGGLTAGLLAALVFWIVRGLRVTTRIISLLVFLILESPTLIYLGLIGGMFVGALAVRNPERGSSLFLICVGGGALLGVAMGELRRIGPAMWRLGAALAGACILVGAALYCLEQYPDYVANPRMFGVHILLGLP